MDFIKIFILSGTLLFGGSYAMAHSSEPGRNLGVAGAVYSIAEPDSITEIENRAKEVNWKKHFDEKKMKKAIASYHPTGLKRLPRAVTNKIKIIDMAYTLGADIPDGKGGVLYPRGYTFNPLQFVAFPNTLVIIDGLDKEQVTWFRKSEYALDPKVFLLITDGSYQSIIEELKRPAYYANAALVERLDVQSTPAVARQKGPMMEVLEIAIPKRK